MFIGKIMTIGLKFFSFFLLGLGGMWSSFGADFAPEIKDGKVWTTPLSDLESLKGQRFSWVAKNEKLRIPKPAFTLGALKTGETLMELKEGKVVDIVFSLYNRGDDDYLDREAFIQKVKSAREELDKALGLKGEVYKPSRAKTAVKIDGFLWKWDKGNLLLEYSISNPSVKKFMGEFIRLTLVPAGELESIVADSSRGASSGRLTKAQIREKVTKKEGGAVYIKDIPMVDQGQKGYCAAAATARVLGYYGIDDVDQHQIAQLAKTDADKGTNTREMMKGIGRVISGRYGLNLKEDLIKSDPESLIKMYNREARKAKKPPVDDSSRDMSTIWQNFDPDIMETACTSNKSRVDKWLKTVKGCVDQGVPVLWGVMLGMYPESDIPQSFGGHLRLIIGYDDAKGEIIFSDTWGAGHEYKTMPLKQAVTITTGMYAILPRS